MRVINIFWVDDDWKDNSNNRPALEKWRNELEKKLFANELIARITLHESTKITDHLSRENFDLLILDYEFSTDPGEENAFSLCNILDESVNKKKIPPIVIFSQYTSSVLETRVEESTTDRIYSVFYKDNEGFSALTECAIGIFSTRPLCFIVMADLHFGYLERAGGIDPNRFAQALEKVISEIKSEQKVDGLFACGDFAWKSQEADFIQAHRRIWGITRLLDLDLQKQLFLCPGNHDIEFLDGTASWGKFESFLKSLFPDLQSKPQRFPYMNAALGSIPLFDRQSTLFSIVKNEALGIVVVGLNSNQPTGVGVEVFAKVDEAQWHALSETLQNFNKYPKNLLRIALLHHPVFAVPGGIYPDEPGLADQAKAMRMFAKCGVSLIFHGHAHFSGIHSHRFASINEPGSLPKGEETNTADILTVACPSLIAEPNGAAPQRQFLVVKLGAVDQRTGMRPFSLATKVFQPATCSWTDGQFIPNGPFTVNGKK